MAGAGLERRRRWLSRLGRAVVAGLTLAAASAPPPAGAGEAGGAGQQSGQQQQPFLLIADTLTYDDERQLAIARGHVQIDSGTRRLLADEVTYDQARDRVLARGNVALTEEGKDTYFGDEVELQDDLRDGFVEGVRVLREDDTRVAANRATRTEGRYTRLDRAVYSPCPLCAGSDTPLWQIKARTVVHDEDARTLTYRDAVLEFFGLPVGYAPWFRHPDPQVERASGFLTPGFGSSSELGLFAEVPYHYVLGPSQDFTFSPTFLLDAGPVLAGEYREWREVGRTEVTGSLTYTDAYARVPAESEGQEVRGHINAEGRYPVAEATEAGFDVFLASDNSYLRRYNISSLSRLENRAFVESLPGRNLLSLSGYYFQGLRLNDDQDRIPVVLPLAESRIVSERLRWGSHWTVDSSLLALSRSEGLDTRRLSSRASWEVPRVGPIGDVYRFEASLRGDVYHTDGDPVTFDGDGGTGTQGRLIPRAVADWAWPLVGDGLGWTYQLEPLLSLSLAPPGGNDDDIPNEDSRDLEFDDTNLFEPVRFPGLDRVEGGGRLAYGLRFSGFGPEALQLSGVLGQSLRAYGSSPFPEGSGLDDRLSDYVGRLDLRPVAWADLGFRFRVARDDMELRRSDLSLDLGPSWLRLSLDYLNLSREPDAASERGFDSREEVVLGARTQLTERVALGAQTRRDLTRDASVAHQFGLLYTHPCLTLLAGVEQSFTATGEVEDETTVLVRIALRNLGEIETGNFLGL